MSHTGATVGGGPGEEVVVDLDVVDVVRLALPGDPGPDGEVEDELGAGNDLGAVIGLGAVTAL
jgi:hypothetical protein